LTQGNFSVVLAGLQVNYSLSRALTTSALIQMNIADTRAMIANIRLRYHYRPDSDLYVVYNVGTQFASLASVNPLQLRERRLMLKLTYSFTPGLSRTPSTTNQDAALEREDSAIERPTRGVRSAAARI